jgi:hypothetical protein
LVEHAQAFKVSWHSSRLLETIQGRIGPRTGALDADYRFRRFGFGGRPIARAREDTSGANGEDDRLATIAITASALLATSMSCGSAVAQRIIDCRRRRRLNRGRLSGQWAGLLRRPARGDLRV